MKRTIVHIGYRVITGQKADLHKELLKSKEFNSFHLIERWLDNGNPLDPQSYYFMKIPFNNFFERFDRLITERIFRGLYENQLEKFYEKHISVLKPDLIHSHFGMSGSRLINIQKKLKIPLIVTFYGVDASYCLRNKFWFDKFRALFEIGDRFIVLSETVRNRLVRFGCPFEKIRIWNCLVDLESFPYKNIYYNGKAVRLITAARFVEKKGYPTLLKAIAELKRDGCEVELTIIGYGPDKKNILRLIHGWDLENVVTLIDSTRIKNFNKFFSEHLRKHHIFILTSTVSKEGDDEAGPALSLISAQAAGLPVVCTPFVGSDRSVINGQTGFLTESENITEDLVKKLKYLIKKSAIWNKVGQNSSKFVRKEFSIGGQTEKMIKIYEEALNER